MSDSKRQGRAARIGAALGIATAGCWPSFVAPPRDGATDAATDRAADARDAAVGPDVDATSNAMDVPSPRCPGVSGDAASLPDVAAADGNGSACPARTMYVPSNTLETLRLPLRCPDPPSGASPTAFVVFQLPNDATLSTTYVVYADAFGSSVDTAFVLRRGDCPGTDAVLSASDSGCTEASGATGAPQIAVPLRAGLTYTLAVLSESGAPGDAVVHLRAVPVPDAVALQRITRQTMSLAGDTTSRCAGVGNVRPSCAAQDAPEDVYYAPVCPPATPGGVRTIEASSCQQGETATLLAFARGFATGDEIACSGSVANCSYGARVRADLTAADAVFLVVDGQTGGPTARNCGPYTLSLQGF